MFATRSDLKHSSAAAVGERRPVRTALAATAFVVAVLAGACGQRPGVHRFELATGDASATGPESFLRRVGDFGHAGRGTSIGGDSSRRPSGAPVRNDSTRESKKPRNAQTPNPVERARKAAKRTLNFPGIRGDGPLLTCPVQGVFRVWDDFGAARYTGGYHPHAGNDIFANPGTPIVAPFDGYAEKANNVLGGLAVKVFGKSGYVYNAHLSGFGKLGPVSVGDVVGYVGNTGDAESTPHHDHFEWHPNDTPGNPWVGPYGFTLVNGAVDPFPFLAEACADKKTFQKIVSSQPNADV